MNHNDFSVVGTVAQFLKRAPIENEDVSRMSEMLSRGDLSGYLSYTLTTNTSDPHYEYAYLAHSIFKKCQFPGFAAHARSTALKRFYEAELQCLETNTRLRHLMYSPQDNTSMLLLIEKARSYILSVLGSTVPFEAVLKNAAFTDGTDSANRYGFTSAYHKYASRPESTRDARELSAIFISAKPRWAARVCGASQSKKETFSFRPVSVLPDAIKPVIGNRVSFVPKNAKTDRAIAVEPHMNVYIQRAIGVTIRDRLKRVGVDLNKGQETNCDLARLGSARGIVSTIDLSMASDTVSKVLVEWLLPPSWFTLLNTVRSKFGVIGKKTIEYEKFSSMGNGFTFELESLIFWALIKAVIPEKELARSELLIAVYGDDLIVPSEYSERLIQLLTFCGFKTNSEKTFIDGPFRESCGKDYVNGTNIRPFFVKEIFSINHRRAFYKLANSIRLYAGNRSDCRDRLQWLKSLWDDLVALIPNPHLIPTDFGPEQGLHVTKGEYEVMSGVKKDPRVDWNVRFLTAIPDEVALARLYKEKGQEGLQKRSDFHLLMMIGLDDDCVIRTSREMPVCRAESDILLNFSKGNPVRYVTKKQAVGFFSEPAAW
jgi:hypothetical protein